MPKRTSFDKRELVLKLHNEEAKRNPGRSTKTIQCIDKMIKKKAASDVKKNTAIIARELHEENVADNIRAGLLKTRKKCCFRMELKSIYLETIGEDMFDNLKKGVDPIFKIDGIMDSTKYRDIILEVMLPYARKNMPRPWIFQQDNYPKHRSQLVQQVFIQKKIQVLEWSSQYPDLHPVEHLWQELKLKRRTETCANKADFWEKVQEE
ncbi:uncharacterized protein LOC131675056 [Phymastichus coffea]|uniref:uncharacterized protein LOC131675056 n=1 Tax=Phymastichus coffea TaxID=108790 RepID=UPI00273B2322|nr:uncharacterized protein LOC131675056 [Phymastichus coffea]